mgnify:CR=1 FL=1|jgi:predicted RNA binding protein YcfA (HicA-like mRNA interferase family)
MMPIKVRELIKILERDGWFIVNQVGSHRQYKHPIKKGRVTVAGHLGDDVPIGTMNNILRQAGLKKER